MSKTRPLFEKRHYEWLAAWAKAWGANDGEDTIGILARDLASSLQGTNPLFDRERFLAACGVLR